MANTDKNIIITPNNGSSTADPNIVFTGGNASVANSVNMTMLATGTLSWDGTAGQLVSITNTASGTIFSVNDTGGGSPSLSVSKAGVVVLAQAAGSVSVGAASGQASNVLSATGNLYVSGNSYVAQNQFVTGNVVAYGSNDLFGGRVGIGTTSTVGANSNVLSVYGTTVQYGNIVLQNRTAGGSGIYYPDGTYQTTASITGPTGPSGPTGPTGITGATGPASTLAASNYIVRATKQGGAQTIPNGSDTVVTFADDVDPQGWFTSNKFQPTVAGYYNVTASVWWDAGAVTNNQNNVQLRKNGTTQAAITQDQIVTGSGYTQTISTVLYFNGTTDYVEVTAYTGNTTSQNINSSGNGTYFVANLIAYGADGATGATGPIGPTGANSGSFGLPGTVQIAGNSNTFSGNSGNLFWDTANTRLGIVTNAPGSSLDVNGVASFRSAISVAGTATVSALTSNGAVSGTSGTFTAALYGASFNTAGTATVNALVSNGAITGTTITGTAATVTSLQNSGTETVNALVSNVYGRFGQNVTISSTNTSISTTSGALVVSGGAGLAGALHVSGQIYSASTLNIASTAQVNSLISNGAITGTALTVTSLQSSGTATVNSLVSNGSISGTTINGTAATVTSLQSSGTATVNALTSNGAVSGTTGTFTAALYGASFNTAGTATVNALVSNTDVRTATVNASSTIVGANLYSNGFVQAAGTVTGQAVSSNTTVTAGTGLTVTSGGMTVTGTSSITGNLNITGNVNVTGAVNTTASNILVVQDPLIFIGANNPGDTYDLGIVGSYTEGTYYHTGIVRNSGDNFWTVFDTLTSTPNVITGNINWSDSTLTYGPFKAGNVVVVGNTASTGTTSGALIINGTGGVGVGGRLNVGGSAWFAGTVNAGGTAIVNSLTSNGAVSGTTGTFTAALYAASFNTAGTATVNALVSNGAISGTTITGTAATVTSLQNSGQTLTNSLVANVFARFGQNVEIDSSNASTSSTNGALQVAGGVGIGGNINVDGANSLFTNRVGIGTSAVLGARANVLSVYGSENIFGNLVIANTTAGGSGIYFPDGSYQQTASAVGGVNQSVQFNDNGIFGGQTNFIYDKTNLRLGIGTTNLTNSLMVFSATPAWFNTTNGADQQIIIGNSTATGTVIGFNSSSGSGLNTNGYISAIGAAARNISITRTGTGIGGVTLPQNTLEIGGTTIIGGTFSGNNNFINPPANGLAVQGSVGVGTFTPVSTLDVRGGGAFTGAVNIGGTATVNALTSNGAVSGTTGTFTAALYGASFNTAGTATVNSLVSNGAVSGTTGTFTSALYSASFNTAGTATVNSLVSNGSITGTSFIVTSIQSSGTATVNALVSNVYGLFGQNVTVNSTNTSTSTTTGALIVGGGIGAAGAVHAGGLIYGASTLNIAGAAQVNSLVSNGAVSGTTGTFTAALYGASFNTAGTATVNALVSNGAVSGTTGTFTSALYGASFNTAGTATVNSLVSNGTISGTTATLSNATGAQITFTGATSQWIQWPNAGGAPPSFTTRSVGTKLVLFPAVDAANTDYAIGIEASVMWNSVPSNTQQFKWYAGTTQVAALSGTGALTITNTATVNTLVSNVYGLFGQNVTVNSTNASTSTTTGALILAGGAGIGGNINVGGANNLFTNRVGIGTSTVLGARANILAVYGTTEVYGNLELSNPAGGTSGIYFADGSYQTTAAGSSIPYSNTNVASYLSGPVQVGNLTINNTTASTSTLTGALLMGGGAGIQGAVHIGGLIYGASTLNIAGAAQVNSLISNGAVSGTTGTFTSALYGASFNTAGTATVNALVSNGAITGTTITGTAATVTSLQNSGTTTTNALISNVYGLFGQNVTINSTNASTSSTTGALIVAGGIGAGGNLVIGGNITTTGTSGNITGVNTITAVNVIGTTSVYGAAINVAGTATVNALVSNGAISGTTITGTAATVTSLQNSGTETVNALVSNVYGRFGQNVTVNSTNASTSTTTGAIVTSGGIGAAGAVHAGGLIYGASTLNIAGAAQVNSLISNGAVSGTTGTFTAALYGASFNTAGTATVNSLVSNGAVSGTTGTFTSALYGASFNTAGTATVNSLVSNGSITGTSFIVTSIQSSGTATVNALVSNVYGLFGQNVTVNSTNASTSTTTGAIITAGGIGAAGAVHAGGLIYGASTLNIAGAAQVNSLTSNGAVSGTSGTFTAALYGASFNTAGTATVNALVSNGAVSGTTGTFTSALYGASFNTAGTATVNALVSNGAISGTTITGTAATVTSLQNSGTETVNALVANVYGRFGQNVTVNSTNTSTSTTTGALIVSGGIGAAGAVHAGGLIYGASTLNIAGAAQVNSLTSNGAVSGTTGTFTAALYGASFNTAGTATVNALVSNGAVSGTSGTFTAALYGASFNTAGTATVNALVSNGAISGTTITGTAGTFTSIQSSGTATVNALVSNVYGLFGQNVTVNSTNASTSTTNGALVIGGGAGIAGNVNAGGTRSLFTGAVGVGTTTAAGMIAGAGVSNDVYVWGNVRIGNTSTTSSGIVFADGTRQTTAATGSGSGTSFGAAGTIQFAGAANAFTGDTANLFWDDTNNRLGLLTTNAPASTLDVRGGVGVTGASNFGGTVTVSSLVSNGAISGTTINGTVTTVTSLQNSGTETVNTLISNVYGLFGQNVTVNSTNASTSTTTGALILGGGAGIGGNINVGGANSLFTNRVGIGTSTVLGARANVLAVYGTANIHGNIDLFNPTGGTSGIYFSDGTYQTSAAGLGIIRQTFTATAGQTTFSVNYTVGAIDVYQNGSKLNVGTDVTATSGTSIVLAIAAESGDTIETLANSTFDVANALQVSGGTVSGQLQLNAGTDATSTTTGTMVVTGGVGISKNVYVGGTTNYFAGTTGFGVVPSGWSGTSATALQLKSPNSTGATISLVAVTASDETAFVRNGYFDGTNWRYNSNSTGVAYTQASDGTHTWYNAIAGTTGGIISWVAGASLSATGSMAIFGTTTSTGVGSGALIVAGGTSVAGNINVGGTKHTFAGNVGIGTSNPLDVLQVYGGNISVGDVNANVTVISPSYITFTTVGNLPTPPAAGDLQLFSKNVATRNMLAEQGPSGIDTVLQPILGRNRIYYWAAPGLNTTTAPTASLSATAFTAAGTATARAFATTNILTRTTRVGYVSAATAAAMASLRVATAWLTTGTGTGLGGFTYICRFGVSDASAVAGARMFVGLSSNTAAATNVDPAAQLNQLGVAQISTDNTQWYFVYGGSVAQTAIALGTALGAPTLTNTLWDLALFSSPGSNGVIGYTLTNVGTNVSVTGSITPGTPGTQTPANTTALTPQIWRTNNATLLAVAFDFASLYIETDD